MSFPTSRVFRAPLALLSLVALFATATPSPAPADLNADGRVPYARSLALSPNGRQLAFMWAGDIWVAPAEGGDARRLTIHEADDYQPHWSPDGTQIAFITARHGNTEVYTVNADGTAPRRVSWLDLSHSIGGWYPDGKSLLVSTYEGGGIDRDWAFYNMPLDGSTPTLLTAIRGRGAALSPDAKSIVFEQGNAGFDRKHYVGPASRDLYTWRIGGQTTTRLTETPGNDGQATWTAGGQVFFLSERRGLAEVWVMPADQGERAARRLTHSGNEKVRSYSVSPDGNVLVWAVWDKVFRGVAPDYTPQEITLRAPGDLSYLPTMTEVKRSGADEVAPSPSGEEMAVVVRGEIFVVPTKENRPTKAVTRSSARDQQVAWSSDGREIFFVSDREDGIEQLYRAVPVFAPKDDDDKRDDDQSKDDSDNDSDSDGDSDDAADSAADEATEPGAEPSTEEPAAESTEEPTEGESTDADGEESEDVELRAVSEIETDLALVEDEIERRMSRLRRLATEREVLELRVATLEDAGASSDIVRESREGQVLLERRIEAQLARVAASTEEETLAAHRVVEGINNLLAQLTQEMLAVESGKLGAVQRDEETTRAAHDAALVRRDELKEELADAQAAAAEAEAEAAKADPADDDSDSADDEDEEEEELEDRPLWRAVEFRIERVTNSGVIDRYPVPSPDGRKLAFVRERGDLMILDLDTMEETKLFGWWDVPSVAWSPDSQWIAYSRDDHEFNRDVWIIAADGSTAPYNVSQHPDWDASPQWSSDGKVLAFVSNRHGDDSDVYFVYTDRTLEEATPLALEEYYEEAGEKHSERMKALKKSLEELRKERLEKAKGDDDESVADDNDDDGNDSEDASDDADGDDSEEDEEEEFRVEIDFDRLYQRLHRVTSFPGNQTNYVMSPDGAHFLVENDGELYKISWNGRDSDGLGISPGSLIPNFSGSHVFYLASGGRPTSIPMSGGKPESYDMRARLSIDLLAERAQKFDDAARFIGLNFYHPQMKGLDWDALTARYRELALATVSRDEFNDVVDHLFGELNGSHLGIWGGEPSPETGNDETGRIGVAFDAAWNGAGLRVASVVRDSPAAREETKIEPGELILEVEGQPVGAGENFYRLMMETTGEPVRLTVAPDNDPAATRTVTIEPVSTRTIESLRYDQWVEERRELVEEWSGGRLGYAHIRGMSMPSVEQLERDLYAVAHGKEGIVLDVRYNGGGWTADILLTIMDTRQHATTLARGADQPGYPQGRRLTYQWSDHAILLCNEKSFSNAEIFSHAWKTLGRGLLVGQQTFGGVISTGGTTLIDGTWVRMPFRGWFTLGDGLDMENNGAMPDIVVPYTPDDMLLNKDPQLWKAVDALLGQIDGDTSGDPALTYSAR